MLRQIKDISSSISLSIIAAFCCAALVTAYGIYPDKYFTYGLYVLAVQKSVYFFSQAAIALLAICVIVIAERIVAGIGKKMGHRIDPLFSTAPGSLALLFFLYGGFMINKYFLPALLSLKSLIGNCILVFATALLMFGLRAACGDVLKKLSCSIPVKVISVCAIAVFCLLPVFERLLIVLTTHDEPNIVFIGVDTLRADHMSCYGYERNTTPNIDAWAKNATIFEQCLTTTPRTTQSLAAIFTSQYPHRVEVRYLTDRIPREKLTLAEILKNRGYKTIMVNATGITYKLLDDGFDIVVDTKEEWQAEETVNRALRQLEYVKGKYFLFVFFRDPHMPYKPSQVLYDTDYKGEYYKEVDFFPDKNNCVYKNAFTDRQRHHAVALYDAEIHDVDTQFQRLLHALQEKSKNNIIILSSDHGESLGEHGYYYDHGDLLHQPGLHVPFIIQGIPFHNDRISYLVRTIDFAPTLLGHLGIQVKNYPFDGVDLRVVREPLAAYSETGQALLKAAFATKRRFLVGLRGRLRAMVINNKKLIYIPKNDGVDFELYDLAQDPDEIINLADSIDFSEMKKSLLDWIEQDQKNWGAQERVYDEETTKMLQSLGYIN